MEGGPGVHEVLGLLAELFTWIGFGVGAIFAVLWFVSWSLRPLWTETDAVVVGEDAAARLRWIDDSGSVQERDLETWELEDLDGADHCRVLQRGERARLVGAPHPGHTFGILAIVFLGLGAAATAVSLVLVALGA